LRAYQSVLATIRDLGAALVAVSSQLPDHSLSTAEKNALEFELLSDLGNVVARRYGLVYQLDEELRRIYVRSFDIQLPEFNGEASWELAVPGTFVIDRGGSVRLAFADPDYTRRLEPTAILAALSELV